MRSHPTANPQYRVASSLSAFRQRLNPNASPKARTPNCHIYAVSSVTAFKRHLAVSWLPKGVQAPTVVHSTVRGSLGLSAPSTMRQTLGY